MTTATTARIRRCVRDVEYAVAQNPTLLAVRPDAKPQGEDDFTIESFFDSTQVAQAMLAEKFAFISSDRLAEAAEALEPLSIGVDVPIAPALPRLRMIDASRGLDRVMLAKGLAVDFQIDRNSVEAVG